MKKTVSLGSSDTLGGSVVKKTVKKVVKKGVKSTVKNCVGYRPR